MKLTEVWKSRTKPTVSFELFPARTPKAAASLEKTIDDLAAAAPDFVSVTFGAGGSTREGSRQLVERLSRDKGLAVVAYFAGYGLGPADVMGVLDSYRDLGVGTVLAVRGDPPHEQPDFQPHPDSFAHASDLLGFLRPRYEFCFGAAGYPEGHISSESREKDMGFLKLKVERGAEFIIANYCYDNRAFLSFVERARALGIKVPIVPGIMPIFSLKMMENLAKLCGATIPEELRGRLAKVPEGDTDALVEFGIEFAVEQCRGLLASGVPGIHIYTMDRSRSSVGIMRKLREEKLI